MTVNYVAGGEILSNSPTFNSDQFQCPHCHVYAEQSWVDSGGLQKSFFSLLQHFYLDYRSNIAAYQQSAIAPFIQEAKRDHQLVHAQYLPNNLAVATCSSCDKPTLWISNQMVYPRKITIPSPNDDLNDEIKQLYLEAATIFIDSPRGSTALLRLALQMLLMQLGKKGKDINSDIKEMVAAGLSPKMQQALDLVRVVGNHAVHPGQIDLSDNRDVATRLFQILNFIADELITKPRELELLYSDTVPEETQRHIKARDGS